MITNEQYEIITTNNAMYLYERADMAHMADHIEEVKRRAFDMYEWLIDKGYIKQDEVSIKCVLIAATLHDIGSAYDREHHNEVSARLFLNDEKLTKGIEIDDNEKIIIANAIREHSSHFDGHYFTKEAEIVASADRDYPDIYEILKRSVRYSQVYYPDDVVGGVSKYNIKRYAKFPSSDYRVPDWHFEYYKEKDEYVWDNLNKFFTNEDLVKKIVSMINDKVHESDVRKVIDNYLYGDMSRMWGDTIFKRLKGEKI